MVQGQASGFSSYFPRHLFLTRLPLIQVPRITVYYSKKIKFLYYRKSLNLSLFFFAVELGSTINAGSKDSLLGIPWWSSG